MTLTVRGAPGSKTKLTLEREPEGGAPVKTLTVEKSVGGDFVVNEQKKAVSTDLKGARGQIKEVRLLWMSGSQVQKRERRFIPRFHGGEREEQVVRVAWHRGL